MLRGGCLHTSVSTYFSYKVLTKVIDTSIVPDIGGAVGGVVNGVGHGIGNVVGGVGAGIGGLAGGIGAGIGGAFGGVHGGRWGNGGHGGKPHKTI